MVPYVTNSTPDRRAAPGGYNDGAHLLISDDVHSGLLHASHLWCGHGAAVLASYVSPIYISCIGNAFTPHFLYFGRQRRKQTSLNGMKRHLRHRMGGRAPSRSGGWEAVYRHAGTLRRGQHARACLPRVCGCVVCRSGSVCVARAGFACARVQPLCAARP